jgi:hypothetical protein
MSLAVLATQDHFCIAALVKLAGPLQYPYHLIVTLKFAL